MITRYKDRRWAWLVALSACASRSLYDGIQKAMGVLLPTLSEDFDQDVWVIGLTVSLMNVVGGISAILTGPAISVVRPYRIVMLCGVIACVGLCGCSVASSWITFAFFLIVLTGIPIRIAYVVLLSSLSDFFEVYYPIANCTALTGASVGMALFAPLTQFFLDLYGWRGTMALFGAISLHLVILGRTLRISHQIQLIDSVPLNEEKNTEVDFKSRIKTLINALELENFQDPIFLTCLVTVFALSYGAMGWMTYVVPYAETKGLALYHATSLATIGGVGHFFGTVFIAFLLAKRVNPMYILIFSSSISGTALILYPSSDKLTILLVITCVYGFSSASYIALLSLCKLLREQVTQSFAWLSVMSAIGRGLSGFMTGWIFETTGSYDIAFITLGGLQFCSTVTLIVTIVITHNVYFLSKSKS